MTRLPWTHFAIAALCFRVSMLSAQQDVEAWSFFVIGLMFGTAWVWHLLAALGKE